MGKNSRLLAAAALASASLASGHAQAQSATSPDVTIGIIDVRANELTFADKATSIEYRPFTAKDKSTAEWITEAGVDHGQMMASAFVRQMRQIDENARIRILAANVFQENSGTGSAKYTQSMGLASKRTLSVNWEGARDALGWFKERGVKVVLTAFNGSDSQAMRSFMKTADEYGMTVFASAGNKVGGAIYPAAYPQAISVAGDNKDLAFRKDASLSRWVDFVMDGGVPLARKGKSIDEGSSFAVAKAAALGAYHSAMNPTAGRDEIEAAVAATSTTRDYQVAGTSVTVRHLDEVGASRSIRSTLIARPAMPSKGPVVASADPTAMQVARSTSR